MPLAKRLEQLEIEGLRGIRKASIGPLSDVNLFVGKNNCGKTTVLEALLLVSHGFEPRRRHQSNQQYLEVWQTRRGVQAGSSLDFSAMLNRRIRSGLAVSVLSKEAQKARVTFDTRAGFRSAADVEDVRAFLRSSRAFFSLDGFDQQIESSMWRDVLENRWDRGLVQAINQIFGAEWEAVQLLPERRAMALLPKEGLPIDVWGDGTRVAFRSLLLLSATEETCFLVEEPECHQHPGSLKRYAQAMVDLARTNRVQLFITTHSDECLKAFVDACATQSGDDRMEAAIFHLRRSDEGDVTATRIAPTVLERLTEQDVDVRNLDLYE